MSANLSPMPAFSAPSHQFAMMIMAVLPETKLSRNGPVVLASAVPIVGSEDFDFTSFSISAKVSVAFFDVERRLAVNDQRAAVRGKQRAEGVDNARCPRIDQAEALLRDGVAVALAELLGVGEELVPGLRRCGDAGLGEEALVVVEGVEVDLVGIAVDLAGDARRIDHRLRPVCLDVIGVGGGRFRNQLVAHQLWKPEDVDAGDGRAARLSALRAERRQEVAERNRPHLDGDVGMIFLVGRRAGFKLGDGFRRPVRQE